MKKRLFTLFTLMLCLVGTSWADDVTVSWTDMALTSTGNTSVGTSSDSRITPNAGEVTLTANGTKELTDGNGTKATFYRYNGFGETLDVSKYMQYSFSVPDGYEFTATKINVEWISNGSSGVTLNVYTGQNSADDLIETLKTDTDGKYNKSEISLSTSTTLNCVKLVPYTKAKNVIINSVTITGTLTATKTPLSTPVISFDANGLMTITQAESYAVYYTTDGSTPSATNGSEYTSSTTVADGTTVKAVAIDANGTYANSKVATSQYLAVVTIAAPVINSYNGTVAISCTTPYTTVKYSINDGDETTYTKSFTLDENATVTAKAYRTGSETATTTKSVSVVPANTKTSTIYMGWGSFSLTKSTDDTNCVLTGAENDAAEGYTITLSGKTGKDYSSTKKTYNFGGSIKTKTYIKLSNGAQNTLTLPDGVKATRITFYSYMVGTSSNASGWKEINGKTDNTNYTTIPMGSSDPSDPDVRIFPLDNVTGSITFTNGGAQLGFIIALDVITDAGDYEIASVGTDGIATYSNTKDLDFTDVSDITAYVATKCEGNTVTLSKVTGSVPGETGLIITSANEGAFRASVPVASSTPSKPETNYLVATTESTSVSAGTNGTYNYVFGKSNGEIGFYLIDSESATVPAGKAYLSTDVNLSESSTSKAVTLNFDGETNGIENVKTVKAAGDGAFYTLSGVRVAKPAKGLYIVNGKKVIVK